MFKKQAIAIYENIVNKMIIRANNTHTVNCREALNFYTLQKGVCIYAFVFAHRHALLAW